MKTGAYPLSTPQEEGLSFYSLACAQLPGWEGESFEGALCALDKSADFFASGAQSWAKAHPLSPSILQAWCHVMAARRDYDLKTPHGFRAYLEDHFQPYQLLVGQQDKGLFTGYYHPHVRASKRPCKTYATPLYKRPPELVMVEDLGLFYPQGQGRRLAGVVQDGALVPYFTRAQMNAGALEGRGLEIAWVQNPVDAFFMMVQGSGTLLFEDGALLTLHYGGANGHPYTSLGKELLKRGAFEEKNASAQSVRDWLETHPEQAQNIMELNQSYVFFEPSPQEGQPCGALGSPLTGLRSLACDPYALPLGAPVWVSTPVPWQEAPWQRLLFAQDVGSAIKGGIRADLYCGPGQEGARRASALKHEGSLFLFWPKLLGPVSHGA